MDLESTDRHLGDRDRLIGFTESLAMHLFGAKVAKITTFHLESASELDGNCAQTLLLNSSEKPIGLLSLRDMGTEDLPPNGQTLLDYIGKNFVQQMEALEISAKRESDIRKELILCQKELETLYEDMNDVHQELSEAFGLTIELGKTLARSEKKITSILDQAPIAFGLLRHRQLRIEVANNLILKLWGKDSSVIGKPLAVGLPELQGQPYLEILDRVYTKGERYIGREAMAQVEKDGKLVDSYFNFIYEPIKNVRGATNSIMIIATDVSDLVRGRNELGGQD